MNKITIILPLYQSSDSAINRLKKSLDSIENQNNKNFNLLIVFPESKESIFNSIEYPNYTMFIGLPEPNDYNSQVNRAVEAIDTDWFTVLQYDDELLHSHISNALLYIEKYKDVRMFCPLNVELNPSGSPIGMSNESVWAARHMDEFGFFDLKNTRQHSFSNYTVNGAIIHKESFLDCGGLKPSIKKFSDREFLLRFLNRGNKVFCIPKFTYKHTNGLEGSIFDMNKSMTQEENKFWYELSKKEYFHVMDRNIQYTEG